MSYSYSLHPEIEKDFNEAFEWYENKLAGLGERFILAVRQKIKELTEQPEVYGSRGRKNYREARLEFFPYFIVYKVYKKEKAIFISSIHHAKKHQNKKYRK